MTWKSTIESRLKAGQLLVTFWDRNQLGQRVTVAGESWSEDGVSVELGETSELLRWEDAYAFEARVGHFHLATPLALELLPAEVREAARPLLETHIGRLPEEVESHVRALSSGEVLLLKEAALRVLQTALSPLRSLAFVLGLWGDERDALALGDFLLESRSDTRDGWEAVYALEALRLMNRRDALMQLQRVATLSNNYAVLAHADDRLRHVATDHGVMVWELQDQLVPTCGLDADGQAHLSYGARSFRVRLNQHLVPTLLELPGAIRHADLPQATDEDDPGAVAMTQHTWPILREQLAEAIAVQVPRLEEAFVQETRWTPQAWHDNVRSQPLLTHLVSRAVWGVYAGRRLYATFRVTEDHELTCADDDTFVLPDQPDTTIGLVHPLQLDEATIARWSALLVDYEVTTLFPQLDRSTWAVPDTRDTQLSLEARPPAHPLLQRGWRYVHGQPAKVYRKHDLIVNLIQYGDGAVLTFQRHTSRPARQLMLRDVPPLVYSEARYDMLLATLPAHTGGWPAAPRKR